MIPHFGPLEESVWALREVAPLVSFLPEIDGVVPAKVAGVSTQHELALRGEPIAAKVFPSAKISSQVR
ncbi:MAG: hypothetical protein NT173_02035, partial [Opitutales bacterium]|nr:hypothetical protein [Opitutales bacterium]